MRSGSGFRYLSGHGVQPLPLHGIRNPCEAPQSSSADSRGRLVGGCGDQDSEELLCMLGKPVAPG